MAVDLLEAHSHEGLALGNVSGVDGYTAGGAGNDTLDVVASTKLVGSQCLAWQLVAGASGDVTFYSQVLGTARVAAGRYRVSWWAEVDTGAGTDVAFVSFCDAAFNSATFGTDALRVWIRESVTSMQVQVNDNESSDIGSPRDASTTLLLNTRTQFVLEVDTDNTYELWADQGSGKVSLAVGTLIAGNVLIDRYVLWQNATSMVSNTWFFDDFYAVLPRADTKAVLRTHRAYFGEITAATPGAAVGDPVSVTITIYSAETTLALGTFTDQLPATAGSGEPKDRAQEQLDGAVTRALNLYAAQANAAAMVGHEVEL